MLARQHRRTTLLLPCIDEEAEMAKLRVCSFSRSTESLAEPPRASSLADSVLPLKDPWREGGRPDRFDRGFAVMGASCRHPFAAPCAWTLFGSGLSMDTTSRPTRRGCFFSRHGSRQPRCRMQRVTMEPMTVPAQE